MVVLKVGDKEYKLKYGYRVLAQTNLLDRVSEIGQVHDGVNPLREMLEILGELVLVGMQKNHKDDFGFDLESESEKADKLEKVYDLLDQYEDESTEENPQDGFELFGKLQEELEKNGFLSGVTKGLMGVMEAQNATKVPMDHKKPRKKR